MSPLQGAPDWAGTSSGRAGLSEAVLGQGNLSAPSHSPIGTWWYKVVAWVPSLSVMDISNGWELVRFLVKVGCDTYSEEDVTAVTR